VRSTTGLKLTLDDIADLRAYERERAAFRDHVIVLKRRRRVAVGDLVTLLFENRDTIRFQVQEMARAERMLSDEQIQAELDVYNPLIPDPGELSATLFVELTSQDALREWLPRLVGIERAVELRVGDDAVRSVPDEAHAQQLTREDVTASVHYVRFRLTAEQVERATDPSVPLTLAAVHGNYRAEQPLGAETREELLRDLRGEQPRWQPPQVS
jgi:hypothetical protein